MQNQTHNLNLTVSLEIIRQLDNTLENVIKYACGESHCRTGAEYTDMKDTRTTNCSMNITFPSNLENGQYTMLFTRFNAFKPRQTVTTIEVGQPDQTQCIDFNIVGNDDPLEEKVIPDFEGGDIHSSNRAQCLAWKLNNTTNIQTGVCTSDKFGNECLGKIAFLNPGNLIYQNNSLNFDLDQKTSDGSYVRLFGFSRLILLLLMGLMSV